MGPNKAHLDPGHQKVMTPTLFIIGRSCTGCSWGARSADQFKPARPSRLA